MKNDTWLTPEQACEKLMKEPHIKRAFVGEKWVHGFGQFDRVPRRNHLIFDGTEHPKAQAGKVLDW